VPTPNLATHRWWFTRAAAATHRSTTNPARSLKVDIGEIAKIKATSLDDLSAVK